MSPAVRGILAGYLGRAPETLRFARAPLGKPALLAEPTELEFNLTHSDWCALVAVARGRRVGVDVEGIRRGQSGIRALETARAGAGSVLSRRPRGGGRELPALHLGVGPRGGSGGGGPLTPARRHGIEIGPP
jgi:hypothetical protein